MNAPRLCCAPLGDSAVGYAKRNPGSSYEYGGQTSSGDVEAGHGAETQLDPTPAVM